MPLNAVFYGLRRAMKDDYLLLRLNGGVFVLSAIAGLALLGGVSRLVSGRSEGMTLLLCGAGAGALAYMLSGIAAHHLRDSERGEEVGQSCGRCFQSFASERLRALNPGYELLRRIGWFASADKDARYCSRCARILNWSMAAWALLVVGGLAFSWGW